MAWKASSLTLGSRELSTFALLTTGEAGLFTTFFFFFLSLSWAFCLAFLEGRGFSRQDL